jgi:Putative peptidoglycan binding domain
MKVVRRVLTSLTVLGALAMSMVAVAAPAQALPTCNTATFNGDLSHYWYWPTADGNPNCVMGRGNRGVAVERLQINLNQCYWAGLVVDGIYGAATERAVRNAQVADGATADGVYGPETRSKMSWYTYLPGNDRCLVHG